MITWGDSVGTMPMDPRTDSGLMRRLLNRALGKAGFARCDTCGVWGRRQKIVGNLGECSDCALTSKTVATILGLMSGDVEAASDAMSHAFWDYHLRDIRVA